MTIDGKTFGIAIPRSPSSVFAGDPETGRLYHCYSSEYRIDVYDSSGKTARVIDRPYNRPAFSTTEKRAIREQVEASLQGKMGSGIPVPIIARFDYFLGRRSIFMTAENSPELEHSPVNEQSLMPR